jgi:hypothetical protein
MNLQHYPNMNVVILPNHDLLIFDSREESSRILCVLVNDDIVISCVDISTQHSCSEEYFDNNILRTLPLINQLEYESSFVSQIRFSTYCVNNFSSYLTCLPMVYQLFTKCLKSFALFCIY